MFCLPAVYILEDYVKLFNMNSLICIDFGDQLYIIACFSLPTLCEAPHNVGKTTTCANLGIGLAQEGKKVLLIDSDPQASLTISLGFPKPDQLPMTLSDVISPAGGHY